MEDDNTIQLDQTPTGVKEQESFEDPDQHRKRIENESKQQDIKERKAFADNALGFAQTWVGFLIVLTFTQMVLRKMKIGLSEKEFLVVFTTCTALIFGFWTQVGKYLFSTEKTKD